MLDDRFSGEAGEDFLETQEYNTDAEARLKSMEEKFAREADEQECVLHRMEVRFAKELAETEHRTRQKTEKDLEHRLMRALVENERINQSKTKAERDRLISELAEKDRMLQLKTEEQAMLEKNVEIRFRDEEERTNTSLRLAIRDNAALTEELEMIHKECRRQESETSTLENKLQREMQAANRNEICELRLKLTKAEILEKETAASQESLKERECEVQAHMTELQTRLTQAITSNAQATFAVGEHIRAKYPRYWDATITGINTDGTITVRWADNDPADTIKSSYQIRGRKESSGQGYSVLPLIRIGAMIEAEYCGWYRATVSTINGDGSYTIDWADSDNRDRIKKPQDMRKLQPDDEVYTVGEHIQAMHPRYCDATIEALNIDGTVRVRWVDEHSDDRTRRRNQIRSRIGSERLTLKVGALVQAELHEWHRAVVKKVNDNLYTIHWQDNQQRDVVKTPAAMRKITASTSSSPDRAARP